MKTVLNQGIRAISFRKNPCADWNRVIRGPPVFPISCAYGIQFKVSLKSEGTGGFLHLQKNIPNISILNYYIQLDKSRQIGTITKELEMFFLKAIARQELEPKTVKHPVAWCQKSLLYVLSFGDKLKNTAMLNCWIECSIATKLVVCLPKLGL